MSAAAPIAWSAAATVLIPLLGAVLCFLKGGRFGATAALLSCLASLAAASCLAIAVPSDRSVEVAMGGWQAPLGIVWRVDGLAGLFLLTGTTISAAVAAFAQPYLQAEGGKALADHFWPHLLILLAGLNALFLSGDVFNLYVTLEVISLAAVGLVAMEGGKDALAAAMRYLIVAMLGSLAYLLGVALLYGAYGVLDIAMLSDRIEPGAAPAAALALMTVGLFAKAACFPLHAWLPPAHETAPAPASALLSGLVVKAAIYVLIRLWLDVFAGTLALDAAAQAVGGCGAAAVLWASLLALRQERVKPVLAYSTVAQIGYLLIAVPLMLSSTGATAFAGTVFLMISHAFAKAAMFLAAGSIHLSLGHDRIERIAGTAGWHPVTTFTLALGGLSLIGLPPSGGFVAKWLLLEAALRDGQWWWAIVLLAGSLLAAGYVFGIVSHTLLRRRDRTQHPGRLPTRMEVVGLVLAILSAGLGLAAALPLGLLGVAPAAEPVGHLSWLPPLMILLSSLLPGVIIFFLGEDRRRLRTLLNVTGALVKLAVVGLVLVGVYRGWRFEATVPFLPGLPLSLRIDALSMLFVTLSAALWLVTTVYAIGYLEGSPNRSRFFGFFSICVTSTVGIAMAGNLITFFVFYEMLTLSTFPLVVHRGTAKVMRAGYAYLAYSLGGSTALLLGMAWLYSLTGTLTFTEAGGTLDTVDVEGRTLSFTLIFILLIGGVGAKAALVPLHGWLPQAMVAPAPVSALLHAVAVVKAGAFGVLRIVYDVFGSDLSHGLGLSDGLAVAAATSILYGSLRALNQDDLKRRLAYSTVSQVSYIILGAALFGPVATIGGLVHLVHQGMMKITLFFCAGNLAETLGIHRVSEMAGVGRRMPWTMAAFSIAALGMIGVPPMAGFISKWYLGTGALEAGADWVVVVLLASSLLNAAYFLPILHAAWFRPLPAREAKSRCEAKASLLWPTLVTAALTITLGLFASSPVAPLAWAEYIATQEIFR